MNRLSSGISTLDQILGGGFPTGSLIVLAGGPGTGKTIMAQQWCFANATGEHPALYYTTLSEPHSKIIRHLETFSFFDISALGKTIEFNHLDTGADGGGLAAITGEIVRKAFEAHPSLIVIDSARALHEDHVGGEEFRRTIYDLASRVAHTDAVLVLVGEYLLEDIGHDPEFAVADGILYLDNEFQEGWDRRTVHVLKMRGSQPLSGRHRFTIGESGIEVFPRIESITPGRTHVSRTRLSTGVPGLDEMAGGGLPAASATLVAGPSGAGKTLLGLHFIVDGLAHGERALFVTMQENEEQLVWKAEGFGWDLAGAIDRGDLRVMYLEPVEMGPDIVASRILEGAQSVSRVVVDGLNELEHSLRGTTRFPEYLWTLVESLRAAGVTPLFTNETQAFFGPSFELVRGLSFVFDNVLLLRYTEMESEIHRALTIVKMRYSDHVKSLVEFGVDGQGLHVKGKFAGMSGVLTGTPMRVEERFREFFAR